MRKSKFTEEQIAFARREAESGRPPADVCRQLGVSEATFYSWKKKFAHLGVSELRRLRSLEDENKSPQAIGRGPHARQAHACGGVENKGLRPARRSRVGRLLCVRMKSVTYVSGWSNCSVSGTCHVRLKDRVARSRVVLSRWRSHS